MGLTGFNRMRRAHALLKNSASLSSFEKPKEEKKQDVKAEPKVESKVEEPKQPAETLLEPKETGDETFSSDESFAKGKKNKK